ncbi:hypothetical protein PMG71_07640 [Roseofilum sp. BLCC_M154]|uniref:DUF4159 domain-containing protein n=1 Tax=Roseofilum acuticapitatum BLCC-M154 TaxID=3022444 RepID=A0ABT7AS85_9CYAN|nr:DUF4159 domain-containing protein [Roseofilum acuticapitatum]MDJ1169294.1 hypothetical protein [Roseofilum acuticapitatum BLCC-M154]
MTLSADSGSGTEFPYPVPLERLVVQDGLLLNAYRWQRAHDYHRQRQNLYYQALHQPGIVYGLGVRVISAPDSIAAQYRDGRWVEVQRGMAIDRMGNPIIVDEAIAFRIALTPKETPVTVYLVLSYVDPETLQRRSEAEWVAETFRIDEKTTAPSGLEVELCRLRLSPGTVQLSPSTDVFAPQMNQLDHRYRSTVGVRPQGMVQVAYMQGGNGGDRLTASNLSCLLQAFLALDPGMRGIEGVAGVTWSNTETSEGVEESWEATAARQGLAWQHYDLIYLSYEQALNTNEAQQASLRAYLGLGGVIFIELLEDETQVDELTFVQQELLEAIADIGDTAELQDVKTQLNEELAACEEELTRQIEEICSSIEQFALNLGMSGAHLGQLSPWHPLKTQPFLFSALPKIQQNPVRLFNWGGVVLAIGDLSLAWGLDSGLELPREKIRNAQELGINLLHFAWRRRHLTQLQQ